MSEQTAGVATGLTGEALARAIWGAQAVRLLGAAIRGDWSADGRGVRRVCDWIAGVIDGTHPIPSDEEFWERADICIECACWTEHCRHPEHSPYQPLSDKEE